MPASLPRTTQGLRHRPGRGDHRSGPQYAHQLREPVHAAGVRHPDDSSRTPADCVICRVCPGVTRQAHRIGVSTGMTLDHLVYATPDLDRSVRHLAEIIGVWPVEGGRHTGLGTRNFLLGLGDLRYLEIIGPDPEQPEPARHRPLGIDSLTGPHLATWAMRVDDIEAHAASAREAGHDPGPIRSKSRRTPAGDMLTWRVTEHYDVVVPFLIDWGTTPHPAHELPVAPLTAVYAHDPDPDHCRRRLAALGADLDVQFGQRGLTVIIGSGVVA
jgi:hypothetical protein